MERIVNFNAILFPSDGRPPTIVQLMTSPMSLPGHHTSYTVNPSRMPHPEVHMDYIAENLGPRAWKYQLVEALDCMNRKFACPYIIFYPVVSRDGMPFPINRAIRDIQGRRFNEDNAWRGNVLVAKYHDNPFSSLMDASMADFPILKNYLLSHGCPQVSTLINLNLLHAHLHVCPLVTPP
ncbi:hypothetical protein EV368DRAFT_36102 [Lentinula lateritia]|uniref:Uncharacterized protein n=1 Tax=Lentinula aff. lateritia TaxID=2804960 RepID=A0ACC1U3Y7_9AGAR|nr:hypothetical protein F5876DRAFT_39045 [Lentinula aff. lateritia]KAJ3854803.1 hypothetical protein EV368DRAFT_36102 [Lentinula lateritia]